jgi:hypothetical protein
LAIEANKRPAPADGLVHLNERIDQIAEVTDDDVARIDAGVLENVELLERGFPRNPRVREDGEVGRQVGSRDGPEYLPLVPGDIVPRSDLAKHARLVGLSLFDECLRDLLLAHRPDLFRVERLRVEAGAGDDRQTGLERDLPQEVDVASHVRMPAVHDAADAFALGDGQLVGHEVQVLHEVRT